MVIPKTLLSMQMPVCNLELRKVTSMWGMSLALLIDHSYNSCQQTLIRLRKGTVPCASHHV